MQARATDKTSPGTTLETTNRRCGDRCLSGQTRGATRRCSCARRWTSARSSRNVDLDLAFQPSRQNVAIHYFRAVISSCSSSSNVALVHNSAFIFCASFVVCVIISSRGMAYCSLSVPNFEPAVQTDFVGKGNICGSHCTRFL